MSDVKIDLDNPDHRLLYDDLRREIVTKEFLDIWNDLTIDIMKKMAAVILAMRDSHQKAMTRVESILRERQS